MKENKKRALGKGLEQLFNSEPMDFSSVEEKIVETAKETDIVLIPINEIRPNPYQPRKYFGQHALEEMAQSIKEHGVLEPVIVKKSIKGYELVAGERRTKASLLAGLDSVPAIVKDFSDLDMMDIALLENIQREDLSPIEIAEGFRKYIERTNITQEQMAQKFGKSRSYITNLLGLLNLPHEVRSMIDRNEISTSHARVLSKMEDNKLIMELADKIIKEGLSVRDIERISKSPTIEKRKPVNRSDNKKNAKIIIYENALRDMIGTKVVISKNKITIPYDSEPDLNRILEILKVDVDGE